MMIDMGTVIFVGVAYGMFALMWFGAWLITRPGRW